MLARALRLALAGELAVYVAVALWLVAARGWTAGTAVGLLAALAVSARALFALGTYAVAWAYRSETPAAAKLSVAALAPHVAREIGLLIAGYVALQPFERLAMGDASPPHERAARLPVLLLHGYLCNRAACRALARRLHARGETVWAVTLEPVYGSIESWLEPLARHVDALLAATGAARLVIVAHSMGGLAARAYLRDHGGAKVARLITLGAPHQGSALARLGVGANAREMAPGSAWLAALAAGEANGVAAPFTSVMSYHDNLVAPQTNGHHRLARNTALAGVGHFTMLFSRRVGEIVAAAIDESNSERAPARDPGDLAG